MNARIDLDHLSKVYGHAQLSVRIRGGKVEDARLEATENPRYFESLVLGKKAEDVHDIVSRICGICSGIHAITSIQATENALGIQASEQTRKLRELLVMGGIIQSHTTHLAFMALPDYIGKDTILDAAAERKGFLKKMLSLKRTGNNLLRAIGGRAVHPLCPRIGGFSQLPTELELEMVASALKRHKSYAVELAELYSSFDYPSPRKTDYASLENYSLLDGGVLVGGKKMLPAEYARTIVEQLPNYSTAKFSSVGGKHYAVGCLARMNNSKKCLSDDAKAFAAKFPSSSPYANNLARAIELVHFADKAIETISEIKSKMRQGAMQKPEPAEGRGLSITEAPRGLLLHEYAYDGKGVCRKANIITPTAQNLGNIEEDIKALLPEIIKGAKGDKDAVVRGLEKLVRAYDPCISCATHFLDVDFG